MGIRYETEGPVAVVTIDRPEVRNAVDGPTAAELAEAFRRVEADDAVASAIPTEREEEGDGGGGAQEAAAPESVDDEIENADDIDSANDDTEDET